MENPLPAPSRIIDWPKCPKPTTGLAACKAQSRKSWWGESPWIRWTWFTESKELRQTSGIYAFWNCDKQAVKAAARSILSHLSCWLVLLIEFLCNRLIGLQEISKYALFNPWPAPNFCHVALPRRCANSLHLTSLPQLKDAWPLRNAIVLSDLLSFGVKLEQVVIMSGVWFVNLAWILKRSL